MAKFKDSNIVLQDDQFMYFNAGTISGTGDIYCNDLYTAGSSLYVGDFQLTSTANVLSIGGSAATTKFTLDQDNNYFDLLIDGNKTFYLDADYLVLGIDDAADMGLYWDVSNGAFDLIADNGKTVLHTTDAGTTLSYINSSVNLRDTWAQITVSGHQMLRIEKDFARFGRTPFTSMEIDETGSITFHVTEGGIPGEDEFIITTSGVEVRQDITFTTSGTSNIGTAAIPAGDTYCADLYCTDLHTAGTAEIDGHMAVGNGADLDFPGFPTYEILLNMNETFGASIAGAYGINLYTYGTADNASAIIRGINANTSHKSSGQFNNIRGVYSAANIGVDDVTGNDMHAIYGSAYIAGNNTTVTNIIGGYFSAGAVYSMVTATGTNVVAGQFKALATGSGDFNVTNTYGVQILTPGATYNGTLTNLYGLYIEDMTASSISFANEYNIYSAGATSKNYFEGDIYFDSTISGTGDIHCGDLYTAGTSVHIGDIVELSEVSSDLNLNTDLRFSQQHSYIIGTGSYTNPTFSIQMPQPSKGFGTFILKDYTGASFFTVTDNIDPGGGTLIHKGDTFNVQLATDAAYTWERSTSGDWSFKFSEGSGGTQFNWVDNTSTTVGHVDSLGNADFHGNATVSGYVGWETAQISEVSGDVAFNTDLRLTGTAPTIEQTASAQDLTFKLGGSAAKGSTYFKFTDSTDATRFTIREDGLISTYADIYHQLSTNLLIAAQSSYGLDLKMGDNAGGTKVRFADGDSVEVAYIDSDGNAYFLGDVAVSGWSTDSIDMPGLNVFVGPTAGANTTVDGIRNTAVGNQALAGNTDGDANVAIGYRAGGFGGGDHNYNTIVGSYAGLGITTGGDNVFIGSGAGQTLTTSSGNVFIGRFAGKNETGHNQLFIENSESSSPLIYGEFDNDLVRINGDLDITGNATVSGTITPSNGWTGSIPTISGTIAVVDGIITNYS